MSFRVNHHSESGNLLMRWWLFRLEGVKKLVLLILLGFSF